MHERTVLPNGVRVLSEAMPHTRSVSIGIFFGAGSRYEQDAQAGASHFLEHMLFKGTGRRPAPAMISGPIESTGGIINAATDRELTVYWVKVARAHFPLAIDLLSDMVLHSTMLVEEMEKERMVILEELAMINDAPDSKVEQLIDEQLWPGHSMGRDVGGSRESVGQISREQLVDYHHSQYVANNMVVSVAGNIAHQEVVDAVLHHMGEWRAGTPLDWERLNGHPAMQPLVALERRKTDQAHICLAFPGVSAVDPRRYPLDLLNTVLGEGQTSRLFLEVRERRGLAYDVSSSSAHYRDCGSVVVYCGVNPAKAEAALQAIVSELDRLREGVDEQELRRAADFTTGRMLLRLEDTRTVMSSLGGQELLLDNVRTPDEIVEAVRRVTPEQVREAADALLTRGAYRLAVVGPYRSDARFHRVMSS